MADCDIKGLTARYREEIPYVFDNSLTYYEQLLKLKNAILKLLDCIDSYRINELWAAFQELLKEFEEFKNHGFDDYYRQLVIAWIDSHLDYIFDHVIRQVFFGLTQDGYFVAYIPSSWDEVMFDTGANYSEDNYGCLELYWDTDATSKVDQTREVVR